MKTILDKLLLVGFEYEYFIFLESLSVLYRKSINVRDLLSNADSFVE